MGGFHHSPTACLRWLLASLPIGFLIADVLWINQYPDFEADRQGGKLNWVVRLGKFKGLAVYKLLLSASRWHHRR